MLVKNYLDKKTFSTIMTPTKTLFEALISPIIKLQTLGCQYIKSKLTNITNLFWRYTLSAWITMCQKLKPTN